MVKNFKTSQYRDILNEMFVTSDAEYFLTINPDPRLYLHRLNFKDNRAKLAVSKKGNFSIYASCTNDSIWAWLYA